MKRSGRGVVDGSSQLVVGDLVLDEDSHEVTRAGEQLYLTATEFSVLRVLMHNPRRVLTKAQILHHVWEYDFDGRSNVVELYISYLRKKVDADRTPDDPHRPRRRICHQTSVAPPDRARVVRLFTPRTWPLRIRLVTVVTGLGVCLCVAVGAGTLLAMRSYLMGQLDAQVLEAQSRSTMFYEMGKLPFVRFSGPGPLFLDGPGSRLARSGR